MFWPNYIIVFVREPFPLLLRSYFAVRVVCFDVLCIYCSCDKTQRFLKFRPCHFGKNQGVVLITHGPNGYMIKELLWWLELKAYLLLVFNYKFSYNISKCGGNIILRNVGCNILFDQNTKYFILRSNVLLKINKCIWHIFGKNVGFVIIMLILL